MVASPVVDAWVLGSPARPRDLCPGPGRLAGPAVRAATRPVLPWPDHSQVTACSSRKHVQLQGQDLDLT